MPLIGLPPLRLSRSSRILKRAMDLVSPALGLLVPRAAVRSSSRSRSSSSRRGPVFFRQVRVGASGKTFRIFKFRTMAADAEARKAEVAHLNKHATERRPADVQDPGRPARHARRAGSCGGYSLDELPQLINVLRGEMSLVGPRPLILDEDEHVDGLGADAAGPQARASPASGRCPAQRHPVRRDGEARLPLRHDWSLWGDLRLIARTIPAVFRGAAGLLRRPWLKGQLGWSRRSPRRWAASQGSPSGSWPTGGDVVQLRCVRPVAPGNRQVEAVSPWARPGSRPWCAPPLPPLGEEGTAARPAIPCRTPPRASPATPSSSRCSRPRGTLSSGTFTSSRRARADAPAPCGPRPPRRSLGDALADLGGGARPDRNRGRLDPESDSHRPERLPG